MRSIADWPGDAFMIKKARAFPRIRAAPFSGRTDRCCHQAGAQQALQIPDRLKLPLAQRAQEAPKYAPTITAAKNNNLMHKRGGLD